MVPTPGSRPIRFPQGLSCPVAPSLTDFRPYFTPLLRVLFSVRSHYLSAIGLETCLALAGRCLPYSRGNSNPRYSGTGAPRTRRRYGAFTLYRAPFQETSRGRSDLARQPIHHIARRLRFGLYRVHSPLLTTSRLVSLPAGTKMFQFPAFPIAQGNCERIPIRRSVVLPLRAGPHGLSQLGTSFVGARAEPFTSWRSSHAVRRMIR